MPPTSKVRQGRTGHAPLINSFTRRSPIPVLCLMFKGTDITPRPMVRRGGGGVWPSRIVNYLAITSCPASSPRLSYTIGASPVGKVR
ncbi:hypothetical protein Pcinc_026368 [Petrolisthes cinctipes]|uniref:Uncharacterized protein n=1 Tax=Petrolisthes cinctipes TaxID=88211 RepID=A0AAE1KCD8_PETCI|nr:hypothetical protein Pcinc_026368 [Petrolisthes cinctipes]